MSPTVPSTAQQAAQQPPHQYHCIVSRRRCFFCGRCFVYNHGGSRKKKIVYYAALVSSFLSLLMVLRMHVQLTTTSPTTDDRIPLSSLLPLTDDTNHITTTPTKNEKTVPSKDKTRRSAQKTKKGGSRIDKRTVTVLPPKPPSSAVSVQISYKGVSGLGHRLLRQSNAYHLSKGLYLRSLMVDWGWCYTTVDARDKSKNKNQAGPSHIDIFSTLFGNSTVPIPRQPSNATIPSVSFPFILSIEWNDTELLRLGTASTNMSTHPNPRSIDFINEVFHYSDQQRSIIKMMQQKPKYYGKDQSDYEMYKAMVSKFRYIHRVKLFQRLHQWTDRPYTVGLHIRQGNGEQGDFVNKKRGILQSIVSEDEWMSNLASLLYRFTTNIINNNVPDGDDPTVRALRQQEEQRLLPPLIVLASDSSNVTDLVHKLQHGLRKAAAMDEQRRRNSTTTAASFPSNKKKIIPQVVTTTNVPRVPHGKGVSYDYPFGTKEECIESWAAQFVDQILLSYSDVVVAGQYSSFTQSMPLSFQFAKRDISSIGNATDPENNSDSEEIPSNKSSSTHDGVDKIMTGLVCNVGVRADVMECFDNLEDWMRKKSRLPLVGDPNGQRQDYKNLIMMPTHTLMLRNKLQQKLQGLPVEIKSLI